MEVSLINIASVFIVLFALIDILGSIPLFLGFTANERPIDALNSSGAAFLIMVAFLFAGQGLLKLFNIDIGSFAIAGAIVIFIMSVEMIFGVHVFKNDSPNQSSTFVPVVFPLIAGPATFTALLSMRADYSDLDILIGLFLNMVVVFIVLKNLKYMEKLLGQGGIYVLRKFFGIILMAMAVKLFTSNLNILLIESLKK